MLSHGSGCWLVNTISRGALRYLSTTGNINPHNIKFSAPVNGKKSAAKRF